jgi:hypothetical protein
VVDHALEQIPWHVVENARIIVRTDSAGATHDFLDYLREGQIADRLFVRVRPDASAA